jgi:hypothetical protein
LPLLPYTQDSPGPRSRAVVNSESRNNAADGITIGLTPLKLIDVSSCTRIRVRVLSFERDIDLFPLLVLRFFFFGVKEVLEATWRWRDDLCHLLAFGY